MLFSPVLYLTGSDDFILGSAGRYNIILEMIKYMRWNKKVGRAVE